jgi:polysaccharide pyruvyl transferase WcaK-like protein
MLDSAAFDFDTDMTKQKPTKICLFGHFGSENSGNEATLLAIVSRLRLLSPSSKLCCICTHPERVVVTHDIDAVPYTTRLLRIWDRQAPLGKRLRTAFPGLGEEVRDYIRAWRTLKGTDLFIVPGTGLLNDAWGLSGWGPYGVLKWSLMARLRGCRVMFVSVGAGPVHSRLARLCLRCALSLADYRSYRDVPSREVVEGIGVPAKDDRIYPDLVFGLSLPLPSAAAHREGRPVVGLGLMEYSERYSVGNPKRDTYERYLESLAVFVRWLLDHEYDVKLLLGDADTLVIDALRGVLRERHGSDVDERVTDQPIGSVDELLSQLSATDLVVATRFHNVLMSLLLTKPVIAISFHHKCSSLMSEMGLSDYCHDINQMNADTLIAQFQALVRDSDNVKPLIVQRVDEARQALDEQYQLLFRDSFDELKAVDAATVAT